jgi:hypothetical protein
MRKEWCLNVSYAARWYFEGKVDYDRLIASHLNKQIGGSGMGMWKGATRDLSFYYRSQKEALRGQKIVDRIKCVKTSEVVEV